MLLNSGTCSPRVPYAAYSLCGAKKPIGVVAPVVPQSLVEQGEVLDELVDRHQLDGRDAEPSQVLDGRGVADSRVRPADLLGARPRGALVRPLTWAS
jgi:hypothetical protein